MSHPEMGERKAEDWSGAVLVPPTLDDAFGRLADIGRLMLARGWEQAMCVYAYTRDGEPGEHWAEKRGTTTTLLTPREFAQRGIKGLHSDKTVRFYRKAWQWAMEKGLAEEPMPGQLVDLPTVDFPEWGDSGGNVPNAQATGASEWFTPDAIADAARRVMGSIDLDPCSTEIANGGGRGGDGHDHAGVRAATFYTKEEDGMALPWSGNTFLNPPYSQPGIVAWCGRLTEFHLAGDVPQAVVLVNNATETKWWQNLAVVASAYCFPLHRVDFWHPDRESAPLQGQSIMYLGTPEGAGKFVPEFSQFGFSL